MDRKGWPQFSPGDPPRSGPIVSRDRLPWRVGMALSRLGRDLRTLPLYKGATPAEIRRAKMQVIDDVVRPLRTPELLKDFLVYCDVVASEIAILEEAEIEQEIIRGLSHEMLVATASELIKDVKELEAKPAGEGTSKEIARRLFILREITGSLFKIGGTIESDFLELLLKHQLLSSEDLPLELRRVLEAKRLADVFLARKDEYLQSLSQIGTDDAGKELAIMLQQILPEIIRRREYSTIAKIIQTVNERRQSGKASDLLEDLAGLLSRLLASEESTRVLLEDLQGHGKDRRDRVAEILAFIGDPVGPRLLELYPKTNDRSVRMSIFDAVTRIGGKTLASFVTRLPQIEHEWLVIFHILEALGDKGDPSLARPISRFLQHANAQVREAALVAVFKLQGPAAENHFLEALGDRESAVRKTAVTCLARIKSRHPQALEFYAKALSGDEPLPSSENDTLLIEVCRALASSFAMLSSDDKMKAETILLAALNAPRGKGGLSWFKKPPPRCSDRVRAAISEALAAMGSAGAASSPH